MTLKKFTHKKENLFKKISLYNNVNLKNKTKNKKFKKKLEQKIKKKF